MILEFLSEGVRGTTAPKRVRHGRQSTAADCRATKRVSGISPTGIFPYRFSGNSHWLVEFRHRSWALLMALALVTAAATMVTAAVAEEATEDGGGVPKLAREARQSIVVVGPIGRDGQTQGIGTGFVISPDGLIATNLHVIGEGRGIEVQLENGKNYEVTEVRAFDRHLDLALIKIDAQDLPALSLGDSDQLVQGQSVVALGNPRGLKHSVVRGTVSGFREIEGTKMVQLAIPIEMGNSGGPLLDMQGHVHGVLTLKSAVTANLGFAVTINQLKTLIEQPNPVPMSRWLTIGALDEKQWTPMFGARWRQQAGRIVVGGWGDGFGGRSICLSQMEVPETPYELAVTVKMDQESGAAGLVFHSDGKQRHYGFYPSNGLLRLSRFDGPTVYTWHVLKETPSPHYVPGEWNDLKVRVEKDGIFRCFVNDQLVIELTDKNLPAGQVGLAKFRDTEAQFKRFRIAESIPSSRPPAESLDRISALIDDLPDDASPQADQLKPLVKDAKLAVSVLEQRARDLQLQAARMERLAADIQTRNVAAELARVVNQQDSEIDLALAALLISRLDDPEVDVDSYIRHLDRMADDIATRVPENASPEDRCEQLIQYLFNESGYHGSRTNYYHQANSYLNRVIDDREGLPITLSVLFMELGRRLGLEIHGVGLPGHFVVKHVWGPDNEQLIDAFDHGNKIGREEAAEIVLAYTGEELREEHLASADKKTIVLRILRNLTAVAEQHKDLEAMLRYLDCSLAVDSSRPQDRAQRALIRFQTGRRVAAIEDLDWFLENQPEGVDVEAIRKMRQQFERQGG